MAVIENGAVVLFQGDSITDAGRDRAAPWHLGGGYALMAAGWFLATRPESGVTFLNRGISGDRVRDLKARWQRDCIDLRPTWVSVMVGINDMWRRFDSSDPTDAASFEADYRDILARVRDELGARLVLCEPFLLPVSDETPAWREDLDPKIQVVRRLARQFDALLVPLDSVFARACSHQPPAYWAADGVHPSVAGHGLIARAWLRTVGAL